MRAPLSGFVARDCTVPTGTHIHPLDAAVFQNTVSPAPLTSRLPSYQAYCYTSRYARETLLLEFVSQTYVPRVILVIRTCARIDEGPFIRMAGYRLP